MLQTLKIFKLKIAAASSKIARSNSSGWKEKGLEANLRSFAQKMKMMFQV